MKVSLLYVKWKRVHSSQKMPWDISFVYDETKPYYRNFTDEDWVKQVKRDAQAKYKFAVAGYDCMVKE